MFKYKKILSSIALLGLLGQILPVSMTYALTSAQDPATESTIIILADGVEPFDGTTSTPVGTDEFPDNEVVRNFDLITYSVEVSLNDADDTNVNATVVLNDKASWTTLPAECRTIANGFAVSPDSSITDTTGDGLNDTLFCNLGDHVEGTKLNFQPVAQAVGNNTNIITANILSNSDNNSNTGPTQGDTADDITITAGFGVGIDKSIVSLAPEDEIDYNPLYFPAGTAGTGSVEGKVVEWHIAFNYSAGSEFIQDDGTGRQDFTITDTWVGDHSTGNPSIEGDNANADYDDGIEMFGNISGDSTDSCRFVNPIPGATVSCSQAGAGQPITISLSGIPVNNPQLSKVALKMWLPYDTVFPGGIGETYGIDNTATLTGWAGSGALVTSQSGTPYTGPYTDTEDFIVNATKPGILSFAKTFDSTGAQKSGQRAGARGEIIETTLTLADARPYDTRMGICDTLDINSFEFAGSIGAGQNDAATHSRATKFYGYHSGQNQTMHDLYNPLVQTFNRITFAETFSLFDAATGGITIEYSDVDYSVTGSNDDHWTATCEDDLDGDSTNDWTTDYTTIGAENVVRVRMYWDRDISDLNSMSHPAADRSSAFYSFDLKIKDTAPLGTQLPNTAATYDEDSFNYQPGSWRGTIDGGGAPVPSAPYVSVNDDPSNVLYSFNSLNADRVYVLAASMSISKQISPSDQGPIRQGDEVTFSISPRTVGSNASSVEMTFTDTLPVGLEYVSDTCAAAYSAVGLTCTASVSPDLRTITFTVDDYTVGDPLPGFDINALAQDGIAAGTYTNEIEISSDFASFTDDIHCDTAVDTNGNNSSAAISKCRALFTKYHSDEATVLVVSDSGISVMKDDGEDITTPNTDYENTLTYTNLGGTDIGEGQLIDILPYNGDGDDSTLRFNGENPSNANTSTQTTDADGRIEFVSVTASSAGEIFEYSTDDSSTIDHRPCHPSNWPVTDSLGSGNATLDAICSLGLIDPVTDVPTAGQAGTATTTWGALPADPADVTAIRAMLPAFPSADAPREITLTMNTGFAQEGDLYCNNFGLNSDIVTLDIISNDVCVEIVAGSIGDTIWSDEDSSGTQNGTEAGISGVTVNLFIEDPANPGSYISMLDELGEAITATTNTDGEYLFEHLPAENYQVQVDDTTLPVGVLQTHDFDDDGTDYESNTTLTFDGTDVNDDLLQDFGYFVPMPDWTLEKTTDSTPMKAGDTLEYEFVLTNTGNVDISFTDLLDPKCATGPTLDPATDIGSDNILAPDEVWTLSCTSIGVTQQEADDAEVVNTATATGVPARGELDPKEDSVTKPVGPIPAIKLIKSISSVEDTIDDGYIGAGDTVNYSFEITNTGNVTLTGVTLTDTSLPGLTLSGSSIPTMTPNDVNTTNYTASYVLTAADVVAGGIENTATVTGNAPDGTTTVSDISDTGTNPDTTTVSNPDMTETDNPLAEHPNDTGDTTEDPTTYLLPSNPSIKLIKSISSVEDTTGEGVIGAGDMVNYSFEITNTGNVPLADVTLTDTSLPGLTLSGSSISTLAPAGVDTTSYTATYILTQDDVLAGGIENTATVSAAAPDESIVSDVSDTGTNPDASTVSDPDTTETPNPLDTHTNNSGDTTEDPTTYLLGQVPRIELYKSGVFNDENGDGAGEFGETISYSFTVVNTGNVDLTNVVVTDPLITVSGGPIATLAVGASNSTTFTGTYSLLQPDVIAEFVENTATVTAGSSAGNVSDISDTATDRSGSAISNPGDVETPNGDNTTTNGDTTDDYTVVEYAGTPTASSSSSSGGGGGSRGGSSSSSSGTPVPSTQAAPVITPIVSTPSIQTPDTSELEQKIQEYQDYLEVLVEAEVDDNLTGESLLKSLPKELPRTGTPISERIGTKANSRVVTDLPSADTFRLAGSTNNDVNHWKQVLVEEDRDAQKYVVVPSNGLVIPINEFGSDSPDFDTMINGREGNINPALRTGALEYPGSSTRGYGEVGNKVVFAHSSYWKGEQGRYKTHFQKIIELDAGEEVWVYEKNASGGYSQYKYVTEASYNTGADDTSVLLPGEGKNLTLFTCTPIGGVEGRWIIKAKYKEELSTTPGVERVQKVSQKYKILVERVISQIESIEDKGMRLEKYTLVYNKINEKLPEYSNNTTVVYILEFLQYRIAQEILAE